MPINVLFAGGAHRWDTYKSALPAAFTAAGLDVRITLDAAKPETFEYIVFAPNGPVSDFTPFHNLKAVLNLWAGVENVVGNTTLKVPLARMVDDGLRDGMVEWVCGHVLRHHLGLDQYILNKSTKWDPSAPPLARNRKVAVLGLGELGTACAQALAQLRFDVRGWSRSLKEIAGVTCRAGTDGLHDTLAEAEIAVLLMPLTAATENLINAEHLALMPKGAVILNPGRGALIDDDALLAALDSGQIGHATLDVFRVEPLPEKHPYWAHPHVTVTPHIASETRADTASAVIADNIRRCEAGEEMRFIVDRSLGY